MSTTSTMANVAVGSRKKEEGSGNWFVALASRARHILESRSRAVLLLVRLYVYVDLHQRHGSGQLLGVDMFY